MPHIPGAAATEDSPVTYIRNLLQLVVPCHGLCIKKEPKEPVITQCLTSHGCLWHTLRHNIALLCFVHCMVWVAISLSCIDVCLLCRSRILPSPVLSVDLPCLTSYNPALLSANTPLCHLHQ
eukprot:jgi/Chrzof1/13629/Cz08g05020.t1